LGRQFDESSHGVSDQVDRGVLDRVLDHIAAVRRKAQPAQRRQVLARIALGLVGDAATLLQVAQELVHLVDRQALAGVLSSRYRSSASATAIGATIESKRSTLPRRRRVSVAL